jgi:hypothetical protein
MPSEEVRGDTKLNMLPRKDEGWICTCNGRVGTNRIFAAQPKLSISRPGKRDQRGEIVPKVAPQGGLEIQLHIRPIDLNGSCVAKLFNKFDSHVTIVEVACIIGSTLLSTGVLDAGDSGQIADTFWAEESERQVFSNM